MFPLKPLDTNGYDVDLTDEADRETIAKICARETEMNVGHILLTECPLCGVRQFSGVGETRMTGVDGTTKPALTAHVFPRTDPCEDCRDVRSRAPEIFNWMLRVAANAPRLRERYWRA